MKTIWKFSLHVDDRQQIMMPRSAKILSCQMQDGKICLWAIVDDVYESEPRNFRIFGTGHAIPEGVMLSYVGTVQKGRYVWHVFEHLPH